ncbi:vacuolar proton atpase [Striga asiatica]|uniref:Vacuolar proton atpase n=1 Tax=Striga asiatica TaxID=4170 RepID=A0A5A7P4R8_STRAF|nr:vacuolar proton atpase [Striga asiatica]
MSSKKVDDYSWRQHGILNVWSANIFPPNYDLRKICSCNDCSSKISSLYKIVERTKSLFQTIMDMISLLSYTRDQISYLSIACDWSARTLHCFRIFLKRKCEVKLGVPFTLEENKLRVKHIEIQTVIAESRIFYDDYEIDIDDEEDPSSYDGIRFDIGSRGCLEQLPVEGLVPEVVDTIARVSCFIPLQMQLSNLRASIEGTCTIMGWERREFFRKRRKNRGKEWRDCSRLNELLEELMSMAVELEDVVPKYRHLIQLLDIFASELKQQKGGFTYGRALSFGGPSKWGLFVYKENEKKRKRKLVVFAGDGYVPIGALVQLIIPVESAHRAISSNGDIGLFQFKGADELEGVMPKYRHLIQLLDIFASELKQQKGGFMYGRALSFDEDELK